MHRLHAFIVTFLVIAAMTGAIAILATTGSPLSVKAQEPSDTEHAAESGERRWRPPTGSVRIATPFNPPSRPWLPGHRGIDLAAAPGSDVTAAGSGTVVFAAELAGRGVVSIEHSGGVRTTYEPVEPAVSPGDRVSVGQVIGELAPGHASCPSAACLHFGVKLGDRYLDPRLLWGYGLVRLLPLSGPADSLTRRGFRPSLCRRCRERSRSYSRRGLPRVR
ncbi:M23 family metallopeptidase [Salininema proteolyticum]|uniref:M23 family metallopeptidase n=1 Tax=Salininema proteolyticum TaxID=1607685 RepID=A0ABV8U1X4_9ACTN